MAFPALRGPHTPRHSHQEALTRLREDVRRLREELRTKERLISALTAEIRIQSDGPHPADTPQNTVVWEGSAACRPSSSSTPLWTEVVVRGGRRSGCGSPPEPVLNLANRFSIFAEQEQEVADPVAATPTPPGSAGTQQATPAEPPSQRTGVPAACRRPLREAERRHSGRRPRPPAQQDGEHEARGPPRGPEGTRPLFPPTTLIIGDSITRHLRFYNARTVCMPGARVNTITEALTGMLPSLPTSIQRIIVHVGTNDTSRKQSEVTKMDFQRLFSLLHSSGLEVFISGPLPTVFRGMGRFSRLLSLHSWLETQGKVWGFAYIDNFDVFWRKPSLFRPDGLHPNGEGSRVLADNIHQAVSRVTHS